MVIKMNKDQLFKEVLEKTSINKDTILSLASSLQSIDCHDENEIKNFILNISKITNKEIDEKTMNTLISMIKNKKIPDQLKKLL